MKQALTERKKRRRRMSDILFAWMLIGLICALSGCAKEAPADAGVQDIVPENGSGAGGITGDGTQDGALGGALADGETRETAQVGRLTLTLPKGYTESTTAGLYLNQNYPDDQSNVYIYMTEKTTDFEQVMAGGEEQFVRYLADAYEQQYEERPEITLTRYEAAFVGNEPAYVAELSYELKGVHYEQTEYIVDAEKTYYIAFSQVGDNLWSDAFRVSAETMIFSEAE